MQTLSGTTPFARHISNIIASKQSYQLSNIHKYLLKNSGHSFEVDILNNSNLSVFERYHFLWVGFYEFDIVEIATTHSLRHLFANLLHNGILDFELAIG